MKGTLPTFDIAVFAILFTLFLPAVSASGQSLHDAPPGEASGSRHHAGPRPAIETDGSRGGLALQAPSKNPFRNRTVLHYTAPGTQPVQAELYNILGQRVRTLRAGSDGRIEVRAAGLTSGLYMVRLTDGEHTAMQTIALIR